MSFARVFKAIMKKWYLIAAAVMIALATTVVVDMFFEKKEYVSTATCYVPSTYDSKTNNDLTAPLLNNFINLSKTNSVLTAVSQDPSLQVLGYTADELEIALSITRSNNLIIVSCTATDALHSQIIANAYVNSGFPKVKSLLGVDSVMFDYRLVASPEEGTIIGESGLMKYFIAFFFGGIIGCALALLPLITGKVPYSSEEIAENFERRVLSIVPNSGRKSLDFQASLASMITSIQAENIAKFCLTPISRTAKADEISIGLADIISDYANVLLIDADFRQPTLAKEYEISGDGLSEYLLGKAELDDIVFSSGNKLKVIPVGLCGEESIQKLLSGSFKSAWREISTLAEFVIIITPPADEFNDGVTLGTMVGNTVLVMQSATQRSKIEKALNSIDVAKINLPGLVLR